MKRGAIFDPSGTYRYALTRTWDEGPEVTMVMLNPSAADAERDDPTIRRCIAFARAWGFGRLRVLNLFAYRTAEPSVLARADDPVGPENDRYLAASIRSDLLVVAWGNHGSLRGRAADAGRLFRGAFCLGLTAVGQPRHPLYLPVQTQPQPWSGPPGG
ncbi:MAG TPA: DUF1643 domain-containing protein [Chloroflexota bacterium]|nr:DUF1643 domain-containing protein [Chloroflexota bacterium]